MEQKYEEILKAREDLFKNGLKRMVGNDIVLSDSEIKANDIIMKLKLDEVDNGFHKPELFNYSKHFFDYKDEVKKGKLYKLIQQMPKGAVLHAHDTGILGPDYVVSLTYLDNLYVCYEGNSIKFRFSNKTPTVECKTKWQLMKDARNSSGNIEKFDADLRKHFTIVIDNPNQVYTDINAVWSKFQQYFSTAGDLLAYKPVWEKYFYDTLKALREENIMYLEVRSVLPQLYDLDGNVFDIIETAVSYKNVTDQFVKDYPDFFGAKLIYAPFRRVDRTTMKEYIETAKKIKTRLPGFLAGFDLVGQEDLGGPYKDFLPELIDASKDLDYFFHAGETNWNGTNSDENILDAILLDTKRIGHGYALIKHPLLLEEVKKKNIALEVNVISNAVLKLVADVRNHPLAAYLAQDVPVVLSSDDPGVWEADPISHDFYVSFVAVASRHADLKMLKKLALNSLYYSTYPKKDKILFEFEKRWKDYIDNVVNV